MKLVSAVAASLGVASASMASLNKNIDSLRASMNKTGRAFQGTIRTGFEPINGYGCWCYLDDTWRDANQVLINRPAILAHGQVVDPIDESCRDLINSYKCIEMDAEANGIDDCDAQAVPYTPFNFFSSELDIDVECSQTNVGECAINACIAEGVFTLKYLQYMTGFISISEDENFSQAHVHVGQTVDGVAGTFDPEVECPGIPNPVGSEKACCGDHVTLSRHPYRLSTGFTTRSCCANTVLNNEIEKCCIVGGQEQVFNFNDACP